MPLLGVGFLLERREHGTLKPGTQTIEFNFDETLEPAGQRSFPAVHSA